MYDIYHSFKILLFIDNKLKNKNLKVYKIKITVKPYNPHELVSTKLAYNYVSLQHGVLDSL